MSIHKKQYPTVVNPIDFSIHSINKNFSFHLPLDEIHLWVTHINKNHIHDVKLFKDQKNTSLEFFLFQKRFESSQANLRYLLSRYLEISPKLLRFIKTEHGKPILLSHPEVSFSMAHSGDLLALAFARHPVGVDLERRRQVRAMAIAKKFFSPHEIKFLTAAPQERFFSLWTAKEAALKADGCGITQGLRHAIAVIEGNFMTGLRLKEQPMTMIPWFLEGTSEHYTGSIASLVSPSLIRWYDWRGADSVSG